MAITTKNGKYIVVAFVKGQTYFLQNGGVISNIFDNNAPKVYKRLAYAIIKPKQLTMKYNVSSVKVYQITHKTHITSTNFKENDTKHVFHYDKSKQM